MYESIEVLAEAVSRDCSWQIDVPQDDTAESEAYCEAQDLWLQWIPGDHVTTVDEVREQSESLATERIEELCEHFGGAPFVYGGNWWAIARDDPQGEDVAEATGGYLRPALTCDGGAPAQ